MARGQRGRQNDPAADEDRFRVTADPEWVKKPVAAASTPREVKDGYKDAVRALREAGCAAAHYRLSGPTPWPHYCVIRLARGWRLVMTFPYPDEVELVLLHQHTNARDPAAVLVEAFGLPPVEDLSVWRDERDPMCCEPDGTAPGSFSE